MQALPARISFAENERQLGERLLKLAAECDRIEVYTEPHATVIARFCLTIGERLGLRGVDLTALKFAALAHDLGERELRRGYLQRSGLFTWEEQLDLWRHPILGEQAAAELKLSRQTQLLIRWHHEWWNGLGYPDGLAGEAIPLGARILRAVDTYCALLADRPHRPRKEPEAAEQIIADLAGLELDPQVVAALLSLLAEERQAREAERQAQEAAVWGGYETPAAWAETSYEPAAEASYEPADETPHEDEQQPAAQLALPLDAAPEAEAAALEEPRQFSYEEMAEENEIEILPVTAANDPSFPLPPPDEELPAAEIPSADYALAEPPASADAEPAAARETQRFWPEQPQDKQ